MTGINKKARRMPSGWRCLASLTAAFFLLLTAGYGLAGSRQENQSGQEEKRTASPTFIKKDLLPKLTPEMAAVKRDPFRPASALAARGPARRPSAVETEPRLTKPSSILESLSLSCLGLVNSGHKRMALIVVDGQAVTLAEGEELIPGIRLAAISTEEIIFRDNQGNSRKVRIKER